MLEPQTRPETGTMQFGKDWPGVFIRGDTSFALAQALQVITADNIDPNLIPFFKPQAKALADLLASCNTALNSKADQLVKSWAECTEKPMLYALIHGSQKNIMSDYDEDCFGYYTSRELAVKALDEYFEQIGEPWDYDETKKEWRKDLYYARIDEYEMNKRID